MAQSLFNIAHASVVSVLDPDEKVYDHYLACATHQWASLPHVSYAMAVADECPHCAVRRQEGGRMRYAELHNRIAALQAREVAGMCSMCGGRGPIGEPCKECGCGNFVPPDNARHIMVRADGE